jgi:hypothetical protein
MMVLTHSVSISARETASILEAVREETAKAGDKYTVTLGWQEEKL